MYSIDCNLIGDGQKVVQSVAKDNRDDNLLRLVDDG